MAGSTSYAYIAAMVTPYEPGRRTTRQRLREVPVRMLAPNFITLLALCAGLTAIRGPFRRNATRHLPLRPPSC